jgi:chromosome segregation protein
MVLLSRLELSGFKSFPERTVIEFDGGITGVVGPNGCGKSNILDSIRWVLGEQRSSVLRSSRMEEIIFSGTSQLKPTGMAEVSLMIRNNRGLLPIEYDDVIVTRRLYRSGESEYLLNKNQCRLKDIIELFFDTGIGPHAYSVIQQGMIDAILSDRTEDRRYLFEEAAGVTKYKYRKKESENKLAATEADLLRIGDVIGEIEKQVTSLRRQAKRAQRYKKLKLQLKMVERDIVAARIYDSEQKYQELATGKRKLQVEIEAAAAGLDKSELGLQEVKLEFSQREKEVSELRQKESAITIQLGAIENEINLSRQRSETATRQIEDCEREIEALTNRSQSLKQDLESKRKRLEEIDGQRRSLVAEGESTETELENASRELTESELRLEKKRTEQAQISQRMSRLDAEIASLKDINESLQQKIERLESDATEFSRTKDENSGKLRALDEQLEKTAGEIKDSRNKRALKLKEIAELDEQLGGLREKLAGLKADYSGLVARRELLQQLIETGEGYSSGAGTLLNWDDKPEGFLLPLAEVLEVPEKYRVAVTAALGELSEIIPVRKRADAESAIAYLNSSGGGRASFLVMEGIEDAGRDDYHPRESEGFIGLLDDLVSPPREYSRAVRLLLGRVALFESEEAAAGADGDWRHFSRVSLNGTVFSSPAIVSGGRTASVILGRRSEAKELGEKVRSMRTDLDSMETKLEAKIQTAGNLKTDLAGIDDHIAGLEDKKESVEIEIGRLQLEFKEIDNLHSSAVSEADRARKEIEGYNEKIKRLSDELDSLDEESRISLDELERLNDQTNQRKTSLREIESRLTKVRIRNVELDGLAARLESEIEHGRELIDEARKMIDSNRGNIERARATVAESATAVEKLEASLEDQFEQRNNVGSELRDADESLSEHVDRIKRQEEELSLKRREKDRQTSALHVLEMEFIEIDSSRKAIVERFSLEFGESQVDPAPLDGGRTIESMVEKSDSIRAALERMEPVNLMAAEDYERENDRLNFLIRQRQDLLEAKASLREAIARINTTAEKRFGETFEKIQANLQRVFESLFEGGEAGVTLEDPSEPLESPIRISARPRGKKMLSVTQLSGGERALTAISLLFAIYLVKPSPFCILDEVDAPLDDANLLRFLKLIREFAETTQFIIITHNKLTMEASDILYGVTMQSPGVSRIVSVKFGGNGDGLEDSGDVQ